MSMQKPSIPAVNTSDPQLRALLLPMKENIELLTGTREGLIEKLSQDATLSDVISKVNEVIDRLNAR